MYLSHLTWQSTRECNFEYQSNYNVYKTIELSVPSLADRQEPQKSAGIERHAEIQNLSGDLTEEFHFCGASRRQSLPKLELAVFQGNRRSGVVLIAKT